MGLTALRTGNYVSELSYSPSIQDSGDLEAGTTNITATAEASGVGNADYSVAITLPAPSSTKMSLKTIASKLLFTVGALNAGATTVSCRVYVDAQAAANRLFNVTHNAASQKLAATETAFDDADLTLWNLVSDGAEHTYYFFFWVDAGNADITLVQLLQGVGTIQTSHGVAARCMQILWSGELNGFAYVNKSGTGTPSGHIGAVSDPGSISEGWSDAWAEGENPFSSDKLVHNPYIYVRGTVATDINCITQLDLSLRR